MARQREKSRQVADVNTDFPYRDLMDHPAWAALDAELGELETNGDLALMTARRYVVGALVRKLVDQHLTIPVLPAPFQTGNTNEFSLAATGGSRSDRQHIAIPTEDI